MSPKIELEAKEGCFHRDVQGRPLVLEATRTSFLLSSQWVNTPFFGKDVESILVGGYSNFEVCCMLLSHTVSSIPPQGSSSLFRSPLHLAKINDEGCNGPQE